MDERTGEAPPDAGLPGPGASSTATGLGVFVPSLHPQLQATVVADHLVLHDAGTHRTHVLNPTAARICAAVDGRSTTDEISRSLADQFGADPAVVAGDVARTIEQFATTGIVHRSTAEHPGDPQPELTEAADAGATAGVAAWTDGPRLDPTVEQSMPDALVQPLRPSPATRRSGTSGPHRILGTSVVVHTDDASLAARLRSTLAPYPPTEHADHIIEVLRIAASEVAGGGGPSGDRAGGDRSGGEVVGESGGDADGAVVGFRMRVDGIDDVGDRDLPTRREAVEHVVSHLNTLAVAHTSGRLLLHAGVVERDGRAVIIVGPSGHGKSTLTAALVLAGFGYLTDEVAAVDPATDRVDRFPKPLSLSNATCDLLGIAREPGTEHEPPQVKHPVAPGLLGSVSEGGRVALLVLLEDPDPTAPPLAGGDVPQDASPAVAGFLAVLEQTFAETMALPDALDHLGRLYRDTPVLHLPRQELEVSVRAVLDALT